MFTVLLGIIIRIASNSYLNVFQKILTARGEKSSVVNFYTYLGLLIITIPFCNNIVFFKEIILYILLMGFLGAFGNYFIIKALSLGELSVLAPINSYKPIVAIIFGLLILEEIPGIYELIGIILILSGTLIIINSKIVFNKALIYRFLALIFSGIEAIFIKKVILLTDITSAFFYWVLSGVIFSAIFVIFLKHKIKLRKVNLKYQIVLVMLVGIMQYSTNYVFSKIHVAYALSLFQLSSIVSVFLGVSLFKEKDLIRKLIASFIMILGAIIIIVNKL